MIIRAKPHERIRTILYAENALGDLRRARRAWKNERLHKALEEKPERKQVFTTSSCALPLDRVYTPLEVAEQDYLEDIGLPGDYPYTRGIEPSMYRTDFWKVAQYAGFGAPQDTNARLKYLIEQGQTMLIIALDLPTQVGLDPDHPMAEGEVGRVGVSVATLKDFEALLDGILLSSVRLCMVANAIGPIALAWFIALAEKRGELLESVWINLQNDPLKEFTGRGTWIFPIAPSVKLATDVVEYCARYIPNWDPMNVVGTHMRWAGATAVQELAFALANAIAYIETTMAKGLAIDDFAPLLEMHLSAGYDIFEEAAKFRAVRRVWAKLLKERFGARDEASLKLQISVYTAGYELTAQQPLNNITRITLQTLSAVLGGVQYINTSSYDEALSTPTKQAVTVSTRLQQIVAEESGITNLVDPLGGSYAVEALTDQIEEKIWEYLSRIDALDGALRAIEMGYYDKAMAEGAYRYHREIQSGERVIVGVNKYTMQEEEKPTERFKPNPRAEQRQREAIAALRASRDNAAVEQALEFIRQSARDDQNIVPATLIAVKAYATIGEICNALRDVYGEHSEYASYI